MTAEERAIEFLRSQPHFLSGEYISPDDVTVLAGLIRIVEEEAEQRGMKRATNETVKPGQQVCSVCWTISWEPVPEIDIGAISDGSGGWMRCGYCFLCEHNMQQSKPVGASLLV